MGGDEIALKNGDKIAQTQDAVVLEKMISQFLYNKASETKEDVPAAESTKPADDALGANPLEELK